MSASRADEFEAAIAAGEVVLFPSDTVYGLACDPANEDAIARLYELKQRPVDKSAAVMFFDLVAALDAFPELGERTAAALVALLPGPLTVLLPNPDNRFPLANRADPETLGLRVVKVPELHGVRTPVLQSSANLSGGADARTLAAVTPAMRAGVNLEIDGGELPGRASTVVDLRWYEGSGAWSIVREGAMSEQELAEVLNEGWAFDPATYAEVVRAEIPGYDEFQERVVAAGDLEGVRSVLELGTGTGETARRVLERHPEALLVGVDASAEMLAAAAALLDPERVRLLPARLQEPLPSGPFDLVVSSLAVHHLDAVEKPDLFVRVRDVLAPGGRFVLGDVVVPQPGSEAEIPLTPGYDKPSSVTELTGWLRGVGFTSVEVVWVERDLAVITAE